MPSEIVRAYRIAAARQGVHDQKIVEQALRTFLGLDALAQLQHAFSHLEVKPEDADVLAVEVTCDTRRTRAAKRLKQAKR